MAVIIDDQAAVVQPMNIEATDSHGNQLDIWDITQPVRRARANYSASQVKLGGTKVADLVEGSYVAVDTGTQQVSVRVGSGFIIITVSSQFRFNGARYSLAEAGGINSLIVDKENIQLGPGRHTILIE